MVTVDSLDGVLFCCDKVGVILGRAGPTLVYCHLPISLHCGLENNPGSFVDFKI